MEKHISFDYPLTPLCPTESLTFSYCVDTSCKEKSISLWIFSVFEIQLEILRKSDEEQSNIINPKLESK